MCAVRVSSPSVAFEVSGPASEVALDWVGSAWDRYLVVVVCIVFVCDVCDVCDACVCGVRCCCVCVVWCVLFFVGR